MSERSPLVLLIWAPLGMSYAWRFRLVAADPLTQQNEVFSREAVAADVGYSVVGRPDRFADAFAPFDDPAERFWAQVRLVRYGGQRRFVYDERAGRVRTFPTRYTATDIAAALAADDYLPTDVPIAPEAR